MIPIDFIRKNPEIVKQKLLYKNDRASIDEILSIDKIYRETLSIVNDLRAKRNSASKEIAELKKKGKDSARAINEMKEVGSSIVKNEKDVDSYKASLNKLLLNLPNLPHDSVPIGKDSSENKLIRESGDNIDKDFEVKNHIEIGKKLNLFDFKRAAKISGSGFPLYINKGAKLERSLINYMLDFHVQNNQYIEIFPPFLVRPSSSITTGNLPKFSEDMYYIEKDDLYLIPTAEVPITNFHKDEIIYEEDLPFKYVSYSACFRREAGSHGKDTRGFLRLHQFNKVELVNFVKPEDSYSALEILTKSAENILQDLGLKYRVIELCSGDLSFSAAKCYDLEIWAPAEKKWLEVSSCSNFESFQARRGNIKYRKANGKLDFLHTLNGSGVATPRLLVAILETYQNRDGTVSVPDPLRPYFGSAIID